VKTRKERQTAPYVFVNGIFCLFLKKLRWGQRRRRKKGKNETAFLQKPFAKAWPWEESSCCE